MEVPHDQIGLYGCAATEPGQQGMSRQGMPLPEAVDDYPTVTVTGLVEKPNPDQAPSNLAIIGRYVLHPAVFDVLERTAPGRHGEIQLTDALATLIDIGPEAGGGIVGVVFRGRRYDTGDKLDYLKTVVTLACERDDIGEAFHEWLLNFVASR
jgi:UTP--glucose-1-phosphate uridylyltransferase